MGTMKRTRYESPSPSLWFAFMCVGAIPATLGLGFMLGAWGLSWMESWPHGMQAAVGGCLVLIPTLVLMSWYIRDRPRLVVDDAGAVRVYNCRLRVVRFKFAEVIRWWVEIVPNMGDEGPANFQTIVVEPANGSVIRISDNHKVYVQAFRDHCMDSEVAAAACLGSMSRKAIMAARDTVDPSSRFGLVP